MTDRYSASLRDAAGKIGSTSFNIDEVTSANFDAFSPLFTAFTDAVAQVCNTTVVRENTTITSTVGTGREKGGTRGVKWILSVYAADDKEGEGQYYTHEIPCADPGQVTYPPTGGDGYLELGSGDGAALKAAIEAAFVSEEGNEIVLESVTYATRS